MKKYFQLTIMALLVISLQACDSSDSASSTANKAMAKIDVNTPDGAFKSVLASLKTNDITTLLKSGISEEDYAVISKEFELAKKSISQSDKAQFQQTMGMLTADGAVDQLMALASPQLEQLRSQLPMLMMMGKGFVSQAIQANTSIPSAQKENATKMAGAVMEFISDSNLLSEEVTRKAISAAVQTAKSLNMNSLDNIENMSFDDVLAKVSIVMGGSKNVLNAYGISIDKLLDSVKVSQVDNKGDSANMKVAFDFLGETFNQDVKMMKKNGKWVADK